MRAEYLNSMREKISHFLVFQASTVEDEAADEILVLLYQILIGVSAKLATPQELTLKKLIQIELEILNQCILDLTSVFIRNDEGVTQQ